jgi:hypothetical protein
VFSLLAYTAIRDCDDGAANLSLPLRLVFKITADRLQLYDGGPPLALSNTSSFSVVEGVTWADLTTGVAFSGAKRDLSG